ncbi:unnamed protein product, partial [Amoebophrya sp. A120]
CEKACPRGRRDEIIVVFSLHGFVISMRGANRSKINVRIDELVLGRCDFTAWLLSISVQRSNDCWIKKERAHISDRKGFLCAPSDLLEEAALAFTRGSSTSFY